MNALSSQTRVRRFAGKGVEVVADEAGPADGTPVILLHGGGQTRHAWGGALKEGARRGFLMLSADLRGHGDSGWAVDGDYTLDAQAADLRAIVDELDQPPFVVGEPSTGSSIQTGPPGPPPPQISLRTPQL